MYLSIIIVNFNTLELLKKCLNSIEKYHPICDYEVIVLDNASTDGSSEYIKGLKGGILCDANLGFAKANNIAINRARGDYVLLLNPDTEVFTDIFDKCLEVMELNKSIGILGCRVMLACGGLDIACRRGFPTLWNSFCKFSGLNKAFPKAKLFSGYNLTYLDENESSNVDCVMGAYMLIRRETIDLIGLLDEDYFMYGEDLDYCLRAKTNGYEVYYYGDAGIIHHKRASSKKSKKALFEFYNSMKIYYRKHYSIRHSGLTNAFVYLAIDFLYHIRLTVEKDRRRNI